MSLVRAALTAIQAIVNHVANTAPNPSPEQGRYHTEELFIFRIAPRVFEASIIIIQSLDPGLNCIFFRSNNLSYGSWRF